MLVVITIIAILIALLLPAVQAAREAARRTQCKSHLHNIGIALLLFHDAQEAFPTGGWGRAWVPVPGRGVGKPQPGGWAYQVLPYLEEQALFGTARSDGGIAFVEQSSPVFNCPSRRGSQPRPAGTRFPYQRMPRPGGQLTVVARGDYAINSGASHVFRWPGPYTLAEGDNGSYWDGITNNAEHTGISHMRRSVALHRITDGTTKTYLLGEKFLAPRHYESGESIGDDDTLFSGFSNDNHRYAASRPQGPIGDGESSVVFYPPLQDANDNLSPPGYTRFGSAHPGGFHMVMCDGSVRVVNYDIEPRAHYLSAHRSDGGSLDR